MKRLTLLLICSLLLLCSVRAQTFSGQVADQEGLTLPSAQLVLQTSGNIQGFAMTDANGRFTLEVSVTITDATLLEVRYFGFAPFRLQGTAINAENLTSIVLREEAIDLQEVVVSADILPSVERGDTIVFNTAAYRDGSEKKIDEVIAKLPGVEVDDNGKIKVQGKPLDRILINGEDVFDTNYKLLSQNVPADFVQQIEVLANYQEDVLVGDLEGAGTTALNLKLDPSKKGLAFGELNGELGTNQHQFAQSNLFYLGQRIKAINFSDFSTLGAPSTAAGDLLASSQGLSGLPQRENRGLLQPTVPLSNGLLPNPEFLRNKTLGTAQSVIYKPGKNASNRLVANIHQNQFGFQQARIRENISPGQIDTFQQNERLQQLETTFWLQNDFRTALSPKSRLDVRLSLTGEKSTIGTEVDIQDNDATGTERTATEFDQSPLSLLLSARYLNRLSTTLALRISGSWRYQQFDQQQVYAGDVYQGLLLQNLPEPLLQRFAKKAHQAGGEVSFLHQLKANKLQYTAGHKLNTSTISTRLSSLREQSGQNPVINDFTLAEDYLFASWARQWKSLSINSAVRLSRFSFSGNNATATPTQEFAVQGDLSLAYQINQRNKVRAWNSAQRTSPLAEQLVASPYLASGTSLSSGLDAWFLIRENSQGINYSYRNQFRQFGYGLRLFKSVTPNGISSQLMLSDFVTVNQLTAGNRNTFYTAGGNFDYYLSKVKTHLKLTARLSQVGTPLDFGSGNLRVNTHAYDLTLRANTQFSGSIKYGAYASYSAFSNSIADQTTVQSQLYLGNKLVVSPKKGTRGVFKYDVYLPNLNTSSSTLHLLSGEFTHEVKNTSLELGVGGRNLLNVGQVKEVRLSTYQRMHRSYRLLPRTIYLMAKWGF